MDSPLKLAQAAVQLFSRSKHFEVEASNSKMTAVQALELLDELSKLTAESLRLKTTPPPRVPVARATPTRPMAPTPRSAAPRPPSYATSNPEYKAALGDPSVIQALLRLNGQKRVTETTRPKTLEGFAPAAIPEVAAEPKTQLFKRTAGISHPILRSND